MTQEPQETVAEELAVDGGSVEQDMAALVADLQKVTLERDELQAQVLRAMADFQNFRRRTQAEASQIRQFAAESLLTDLLPVLDNFERTLEHLGDGATLESVSEGIQAVNKQLRSVLESQKLQRIESVGQPFDPELHEAIGTEPVGEFDDGIVSLEVQAGYRLGDRVIRPARVKVAKG